MQSVALEALDKFRAYTLSFGSGKTIPFILEDNICTTDASQQSNQQLQQSQQSPVQNGQQPKSDCKPGKRTTLTPWSLLIGGGNTQANLNSSNDLASVDYNIFSSIYGLKYDINSQWSAGVSFGYGQANLYNYEYSDAHIDSSTYAGSIWGAYYPSDSWKITGLIGYMNLRYESERKIAFGGINRTASASWSGNGFVTAIGAEYDWIISSDKQSRSAVRLKPSTFLAYALHSQGDITESGAGSLDLAIAGQSTDSLLYGLGLTLETPIITAKNSRLIPRLSLGYEYNFNGNSNGGQQISSSFVTEPALGSVTVLGQNRGANALDLGLSLEYESSATLSVYAGIGGAFWSNGNELSYGGGVRLRW
jgi:outer membrane autotransporter protein